MFDIFKEIEDEPDVPQVDDKPIARIEYPPELFFTESWRNSEFAPKITA